MRDHSSAFQDRGAQVLYGALNELIAIRAGDCELLPPYAGKGQQVLDQTLHACGAVDCVTDIFVSLIVEFAAIAFRQQLGVGRHHTQRLLQVVGGDVGELFQVAIGAGQFLHFPGHDSWVRWRSSRNFLSFNARRNATGSRASESLST
jgi:hypothetical protein